MERQRIAEEMRLQWEKEEREEQERIAEAEREKLRKQEEEKLRKLEDLDNFLGGLGAPKEESNPMDDVLSIKPVSIKSRATKKNAIIRKQE
jgi:hypothetical protein